MKFKLMTYNVQDLFLKTAYPLLPRHLEGLSEEHWQLLAEPDQELKPLSKLTAIAQIILDESPDLVCLCEVGGLKSLQTFNETFLAGAYSAYLVAGNSDRGIESGFLLKKTHPLTATIESHRDWPVPFNYFHEEEPATCTLSAMLLESLKLGSPESRKLSRDIPVLHLFGSQGDCLLSVILVHLKSGYDPYNIDSRGQKRRAAELAALVEIYSKIRAHKGDAHPIIVTGDFNGNASRDGTAPEFTPLYDSTDLDDALYLAGIPRYERHTHMTFIEDRACAQQLDYIFLGGSLRQRLIPRETYVYRYTEGATEMLPPFSFHDRALLPSDHYPVICTLELPTSGG